MRVLGFVLMGYGVLVFVSTKLEGSSPQDRMSDLLDLAAAVVPFVAGVLLWVVGSCIPMHLDDEPRQDDEPQGE